jgi:hypothetical protein
MNLETTDFPSDSSAWSLGGISFPALAQRLSELEEWGWVSEDSGVDDATKEEIFSRIFPSGDTTGGWNDYHLVRSEYDRRAAEEFDLGQ